MTARLSPNVASKRANQAAKARFKALRLNGDVDPQHVFAGRIVQLLKAASNDNPGEWNEAWTEYVLDRFSSRYLRLCQVAPISDREPRR